MRFLRLFFAMIALAFVCPMVTVGSEVDANAEELVLPIDRVFDQGGTLWCWAYSSFHTLRTYFSQNPDSAWDQAREDLDAPEKLRAFLAARVPRNEKHYPYYFVKLMEAEYGLDSTKWLAYFRNPRCRVRVAPGGEGGITLPNMDVPVVIMSSLQRGAPVVHCDGVHCISIYGAKLDSRGEAEQYYIADSLGGLGRRSAQAVHENFCSMMTLGPQ